MVLFPWITMWFMKPKATIGAYIIVNEVAASCDDFINNKPCKENKCTSEMVFLAGKDFKRLS